MAHGRDHHAILSAFGLKAESYTLTQLRYDLRKMKAHGLVERDGKRYAYRLTGVASRTDRESVGMMTKPASVCILLSLASHLNRSRSVPASEQLLCESA